MMINDPQIFAMKITRSFTSDTFKTGDLLDYLIFSDMRAGGSFHHLPQLSPSAGRIAESL